MKNGEREVSRIKTEYEPVQPTYAQSISRVKKPSLDDMGPGTDRPVPARKVSDTSRRRRVFDTTGLTPSTDDDSHHGVRPRGSDTAPIDPRTKAGAFGEKIAGPHKPTLDEMGPHASLPVKISTGGLPAKPATPTRTRDFEDPGEKKGRGRPKKTGRPGR